MPGAVCPACGVAVVPGYVRCPKCHRALPRFARNSTSPVGGTTLAKGGSPVLAIVAAVAIGGGVIAYFALRGKNHAAAAEPAPVQTSAGVPATAPAVATQVPSTPSPAAASTPRGPTPDAIAADLEHSLRHARLWSTVDVIGDHVDVRSGSCSDPAMKPALDAAAGSFKAAGLTRLRCLEQSGSVVIDRDL